jgi:hypothetical protein
MLLYLSIPPGEIRKVVEIKPMETFTPMRSVLFSKQRNLEVETVHGSWYPGRSVGLT